MVGKHLDVHDGKAFKRDLATLKVAGLREAIHERRIFEPLEGVEIRPFLWSDEVMMPGHAKSFRYLFIKGRNEIFLLRVAVLAFSEKDIAYFAAMAEKYS